MKCTTGRQLNASGDAEAAELPVTYGGKWDDAPKYPRIFVA